LFFLFLISYANEYYILNDNNIYNCLEYKLSSILLSTSIEVIYLFTLHYIFNNYNNKMNSVNIFEVKKKKKKKKKKKNFF